MKKFNYRMIKFSFLLVLLLMVKVLSYSQISVTGYNHVALSVKDLSVSAAFYREFLGLKQIRVPENLTDIRAWFEIGPAQELHLLAGRTTDVCQNVNDKNGSHFSLTVPAITTVEEYLKSKIFPYHIQQRFDGAWQIYITDPDGYVIELNEPKK